jgi:hypothetical protein
MAVSNPVQQAQSCRQRDENVTQPKPIELQSESARDRPMTARQIYAEPNERQCDGSHRKYV